MYGNLRKTFPSNCSHKYTRKSFTIKKIENQFALEEVTRDIFFNDHKKRQWSGREREKYASRKGLWNVRIKGKTASGENDKRRTKKINCLEWNVHNNKVWRKVVLEIIINWCLFMKKRRRRQKWEKKVWFEEKRSRYWVSSLIFFIKSFPKFMSFKK